MRSRAGIVALLVGLLALACTSGGQQAQQSPPAREQASEEPVRGGTLVVGISSDPGGLNPAITTSGATHTAAELMFNRLVGLGPELEPVPELAERWDIELIRLRTLRV